MVALVPTSQWVYALARVTWHETEDGPARAASFCAFSNDNHLELDIAERTTDHYPWWKWELVADDVGHPRVIGSFYGAPLHEDGWAHGQWVAERMGLV